MAEQDQDGTTSMIASRLPLLCRDCGHEWRKPVAAIRAQAVAVVATGACPDCGSALRRNNSIAGWWMCEQRGADAFRARPQDAPCAFQCFTE